MRSQISQYGHHMIWLAIKKAEAWCKKQSWKKPRFFGTFFRFLGFFRFFRFLRFLRCFRF